MSKQSLWEQCKVLWNELIPGEKFTYSNFQEGLGGKDFSDEIRKASYQFLTSLTRSGRCVKKGKGEKSVFIKVMNYEPKNEKGDGTVTKNIITILNELDFTTPYTISDMMNLYEKRVGEKISRGGFNLILFNACTQGIFTREKSKTSRSIEYSKVRQIVPHMVPSLTKRRTKKKVVKQVKAISNNSEKINECFSEDRDNVNKQIVESFFIESVKQYLKEKIRCLSLTGPDYKRHVDKLFTSIARELFIVEIKNGVFEEILAKAKECPFYRAKRVKLINSDVKDIIIDNCKYIDLDFMTNLITTTPVIVRQIKSQIKMAEAGLKFITFTGTNRKDGGEVQRLGALTTILKNGFGADLIGFHGTGTFGDSVVFNNKTKEHNRPNYTHKKIPILSNYGRIVEIQVFTYADTNPMISVLVIYK